MKLFFAWIGFLSVCPWSWAQSPSVIGELFPTEDGAHNAALLAGSGMSVTSGSQLSAGQSVASLILSRGGQVRICPQSSMSVNAIPNTEGLLLALDTGSLEINYPINVLTDTLITPDFKLQLVGPGTFHFALGFNNRGDTCVRSLRGNTSGIIVSESMGTGTYQVKPDEQVLFAKGKLGDHFSSGIDCGCPAPQPPVLRAQENPEANPTAELPPQKADDVRVKVDVPLVFRGNTGNAAGTAPEPEPAYMPAKIQFSTLPDVFTLQATMEPLDPVPAKKAPVSTEKREKKGFFARLKGFFASIFHR